MNSNYYCVIMAGGVGARFWPMSTINRPKQFIDIMGDGETLIEKTYKRFLKICPAENIYIVTNTSYKKLVTESIPGIKEDQIICEPNRRNTAPCIAYANYKIKKINPDAIIAVSPSDHIITDEDLFVDTINTALSSAENNNWLITLGISPTRPETGYGYIQFDETKLSKINDRSIFKVKVFTEKPAYDMAVTFLRSGDFLWNAGIFVWSLKSINKAFKLYLPEIDEIFRNGETAYNTPNEEEFILKAYSICRSISIDYGIMEKAENVQVIACSFGWSDLGTWGSLYENRNKDANNNAISGKNVLTFDSKNNIINVPEGKLVVVQGLDDYIVAEHDGVLLICKKQEEQQIREFVNNVKLNKGEKYV